MFFPSLFPAFNSHLFHLSYTLISMPFCKLLCFANSFYTDSIIILSFLIFCLSHFDFPLTMRQISEPVAANIHRSLSLFVHFFYLYELISTLYLRLIRQYEMPYAFVSRSTTKMQIFMQELVVYMHANSNYNIQKKWNQQIEFKSRTYLLALHLCFSCTWEESESPHLDTLDTCQMIFRMTWPKKILVITYYFQISYRE